MSQRHFIHFSELALSRKVLFTGALCTLGFGYLFAMAMVWISHAGRDGSEMLSVKDVVIAYAGSDSGTRLEGALKGPMSKMLPANENLQVVEWVLKGTNKEQFDSKIGAIFEKRCVVCHNDRNPHLPSLESYEKVLKVAEKDTGANYHTLIRVSHIHLFGLTFIFFIVTFIFSHAYFRREWLKSVIIIIPFISICADIVAWFLTKVNHDFALMVIGAGAGMGSCFGIMFVVSMWQMWISRKLPEHIGKGDEVIDEDVVESGR
ncbi:MAG: elongation factor-1 alpha [Gallionella sp.]|nr:MAG: elongation factor-1 alpha [Gallionella sp.]